MPSAGAGTAHVVYDASELLDVVQELERRGRSLAHFTPAIAEELVSEVEEVFLEEGAVGGKPKWQDLADSTKASRRGSEPYTILRDSTVLFNSLQPSSGPTEAAAGTDVPYGKWHIVGTDDMVKRDWTEIDFETFTDEVADMLLQDVLQ